MKLDESKSSMELIKIDTDFFFALAWPFSDDLRQFSIFREKVQDSRFVFFFGGGKRWQVPGEMGALARFSLKKLTSCDCFLGGILKTLNYFLNFLFSEKILKNAVLSLQFKKIINLTLLALISIIFPHFLFTSMFSYNFV